MQDIPELCEVRAASDQSPEIAAKMASTMTQQAFALYLSGSLRNSAMQSFGHATCKIYFDELIQSVFPGVELGRVDPILRMQIEQVVLLHHNIGTLFTEGTSRQAAENRKTVLSLAAQLLTEFRRLSTIVREELASLKSVDPHGVAQPNFNIRGRSQDRPSSQGSKKEVA